MARCSPPPPPAPVVVQVNGWMGGCVAGGPQVKFTEMLPGVAAPSCVLDRGILMRRLCRGSGGGVVTLDLNKC